MTQLSREKLEELSNRQHVGAILSDEIAEMARRLLAAEAQVDEVPRQEGINPAVAEAYMQGYHDSESRKPAQPVAVPDVLLSAMEEVLRISDRDHEAWHRARDGIAAYRAAMLSAEPVSQPYKLNSPEIPDCWCRTCRPVSMTDMRFVVCPDCGNKRCPRANDHRNACSGSNEPWQEGSSYPAAPQEPTK